MTSTTGFTQTDDDIVAQLSSAVSIIQRPGSQFISLVRQPTNPTHLESIITLSTQAEEALLAFLLARRGIKATPLTGPGPQGAPRSFDQHTHADAHPRRYATDVHVTGREIRATSHGRVVATADTPGWAVQLAAAWNAERA